MNHNKHINGLWKILRELEEMEKKEKKKKRLKKLTLLEFLKSKKIGPIEETPTLLDLNKISGMKINRIYRTLGMSELQNN